MHLRRDENFLGLLSLIRPIGSSKTLTVRRFVVFVNPTHEDDDKNNNH